MPAPALPSCQRESENMAETEPSNHIESPELSAIPMERVVGAFVFWTVIFVILAAFFFVKVPIANELYAVPQFFVCLALVTPIMLWQTVSDRSKARRISVWSSGVIWVLGILMAFIFKPGSPFLPMSDGLLFAGFFPLLYLWRFSIPWIVFGVFNGAIGIFLLLVKLLKDSYFPESMWAMKHHLGDYHAWIMWLAFGLAACIFGLVRLSKNIYKMIARRMQANSAK